VMAPDITPKQRTAKEPLPSFIWPRNTPYTDNVATLLPDPLRSSAGDGAFLYRWALKKMTCPIDAIAAADAAAPPLSATCEILGTWALPKILFAEIM
jgi:hypothetical protein